MSLTSNKSGAQIQVSAGLDRARQAATRVTPMAKNASATAAQSIQNARDWAGPRIEQGVHDAREWATPRIERGMHDAREWAAPRIEHATHAFEETVAPKVSSMLTATAHRVDPSSDGSQTRRRNWLRLLAGLTAVSALGGIVAGIMRKRGAKLPDAVMPEDDMTGTEAQDTPETGESERMMAEAEVGINGKGQMS